MKNWIRNRIGFVALFPAALNVLFQMVHLLLKAWGPNENCPACPTASGGGELSRFHYPCSMFPFRLGSLRVPYREKLIKMTNVERFNAGGAFLLADI